MFNYIQQRQKKTSSANNPERSDQIGSGSLTNYNDQRRQRQPSIQQRDQIKSGQVHLLIKRAKKNSVNRQSSREIRSNRIRFTYRQQKSHEETTDKNEQKR